MATIAGEEVTSTLPAPPVVHGSLNAVIAITQSACYYVVRCLIEDEVPMNAGCFAPVHAIAPATCSLTPARRSPWLRAMSKPSQRITDAVLGAGAGPAGADPRQPE